MPLSSVITIGAGSTFVLQEAATVKEVVLQFDGAAGASFLINGVTVMAPSVIDIAAASRSLALRTLNIPLRAGDSLAVQSGGSANAFVTVWS